PLMASYSLLLFEGNVRSASILGIVGAGGVGFILSKYMALFKYQELLGALILIIIAVTIIDRLSDAIRRRLV
ncbi:MAG: phosphonate ABC transporter, permease protein PhnE, partial [Chloroflexota bacterium]|nr:phosphonate ABC transporter, permease protein PhnE [Chloroflexota bacterium]